MFSIVCPVYQLAPWLDEALESLRAQSYEAWEGLCVDDGSRDDSGEILLRHLREDARLRVTFQPNRGVSAARNRALAQARGAWVGFLDGDDVVAPWWLAMAKACAEDGPHDLIRFTLQLWNGRTPPTFYPVNVVRVFTGPAEVREWCEETFTRAGFVYAYLVRRALAQTVTFPEGLAIKEDCLYGLRLAPLVKSVLQCAAVPYAYRRRRNSALHRKCSVEVPLRLFREFQPYLSRGVAREAFADFWLRILTDWVTRMDPRDAERIPEVQEAFTEGYRAAGLTFQEVVPWHWRGSVRWFLKRGGVLPMQVHSFLYRVYKKVVYCL